MEILNFEWILIFSIDDNHLILKNLMLTILNTTENFPHLSLYNSYYALFIQ